VNSLSILHVDTGTDWRGGQAQVLSLMEGLALAGHRQCLAAPNGPLAERARRVGLPVAEFTSRSDLDLLAAAALSAFARRLRPDIVHAHTARAHPACALAARLARSACVVSRRVLFTHADGSPRGLSLKYRLPVDLYLCVSRAIRDGLARAGVPEARLRVVHDGVDVPGTERAVEAARANGRSAALRARWGTDGLVGILAAFTPEKDHATFLDAARLVSARRPATRFVLSGEGPLRAALEARAEALGLEDAVALPGFVPDLPALLGALDVLVLCSRFEGLGTSVLLAQAARVPVVATRVGGVPESVEDGATGLLVPAGDPDALAGAILRTLSEREESEGRVRRARRSVEEFDVARLIARTEAAYREVVAG
jgi:glycosyltransferase involved in cell wall biosynthesis